MLEAIALKCLSKVFAGASADSGAGDVDGIVLRVDRVACFDDESVHRQSVALSSDNCAIRHLAAPISSELGAEY